MPSADKLIAWVEQTTPQDCVAAFVAAMASRRQPAMRRCASPDEARHWVESQAAEFDVAVEWVDRAPSPS
jgi:hypothetical protein